MDITTKTEKMKEIRDELLNFKNSPLYDYRVTNGYYPVVGEGNHDASIMFVGEAPGQNEAKTAKPFCGSAGKFLTELITSIGLTRESVYITNLVKDRPPENRDPTPEEVVLYAPFLDRQIEIIQPKVIATLGRHSMSYIMTKYDLALHLAPISKIHGKKFQAVADFGPISVVTLYHPAAALYNGGTRDIHKKDFEILKEFV